MRRNKRRTIIAAGVICGIVLAWAASPIFSSRQPAQGRMAVTWPRPTASHTVDRASVDRYYKELVKDANQWVGIAFHSAANSPSRSPHFRSVDFTRPIGSDNEIKIDITSEDWRLSRYVVAETAARMVEWTANLPGGPILTVVKSPWDEVPGWPTFSFVAMGAALGLLAGLIMAGSLPQE